MEKDKKMERLKNRLIKIQGKIQDRMEDLQDQVQNKYDKSKISKFISHLSEDRSSYDGESNEDKTTDCDNTSTESGKAAVDDSRRTSSIPSVVVDEPVENAKHICENFISIERNGVLYKRRSLSTSDLAFEDNTNSDNTSESCVSCISSSDER